jgi:hypothetical protein
MGVVPQDTPAVRCFAECMCALFSILRPKGWPLCFTPSEMGKELLIPLPARPF